MSIKTSSILVPHVHKLQEEHQTKDHDVARSLVFELMRTTKGSLTLGIITLIMHCRIFFRCPKISWRPETTNAGCRQQPPFGVTYQILFQFEQFSDLNSKPKVFLISVLLTAKARGSLNIVFIQDGTIIDRLNNKITKQPMKTRDNNDNDFTCRPLLLLGNQEALTCSMEKAQAQTNPDTMVNVAVVVDVAVDAVVVLAKRTIPMSTKSQQELISQVLMKAV
ncbi:hypothetical protein BJV82DRAFT_41307 [Fennellomyces sp. T-0311]|nr:hypothetical protein BJV82DRAFT_41307 [Fennellomyces sp. T-0311]